MEVLNESVVEESSAIESLRTDFSRGERRANVEIYDMCGKEHAVDAEVEHWSQQRQIHMIKF